MDKIKVIFVVGPTASGKTALGVDIALRYNGEVISADSMQLYRGIHIASAAPDSAELCNIKHHMIELLPLSATFTVADYADRARTLIAEIHSRGRLPVIVGGTGLYISVLADHICFIEQPTDETVRKRLIDELERDGAEKMLSRLCKIDPETASRLHPNNTRRIIRALEIYETTGKTFSQANEESHSEESPYAPVMLGLTFRDRGRLYERIDTRVDRMLEGGLLEEARATLALNSGKGAAQAIGHKELYPYLRGELPLEAAVENLKRATRRYAKRQLTWFGRDERIRWIYADETSDIAASAYAIMEEKDKEENRCVETQF